MGSVDRGAGSGGRRYSGPGSRGIREDPELAEVGSWQARRPRFLDVQADESEVMESIEDKIRTSQQDRVYAVGGERENGRKGLAKDADDCLSDQATKEWAEAEKR